MKRFFALLKDKPRLYNIVFNSDTRAGKIFDIAVMVAIVLSLLVAFIETKPAVMGRFKDVLTILEYVLTFFFTIWYRAVSIGKMHTREQSPSLMFRGVNFL